ncbi:MAG: tetratricopeptide repeat protein [Bacteroidales bacterium]|nr:tetratricopeptide repeat protein [Bacteroidales bacterium]
MSKIFKYSVCISIFVFLIVSCSTKKNTGITRWYHNLTSKYNILFNGEESYNKGMLKLEQSYDDDFTEIIPVFLYTQEDALAAIAPEMDRSITKATKLITMHSLTVKPDIKADKELSPKQKEFYSRKEYNKWIDEAYLLMGKAHFHKMEYSRAEEVFNYILSNYAEDYSIFEARMWLARLANEESRFKESEELLNSLERNLGLPKKLKGEVQATIADYYIKQEKYNEAIEHLKSAIEHCSRKPVKTRYTYLLAQLYSQINENILSSEYYSKVIRMNPPYKMAFNAKISRALAYQSGAGMKKDIEKELRKMLKDDKNIDYQDQIYFALGNLYFKDKNEEKAIENYKLSLQASTDNLKQKAKTNITLADLYYSRPDYINAQAYYDSTVTLIDENYPNYKVILNKSVSLGKLVESINTVHFEDSVLALSYLSEAKLYEIIDEMIDRETKAEEERMIKQQELAQQQIDFQANKNDFELAGQGNAWYFYNSSVKSLGKKEFMQVWGNRKLEDNWRRKNKSSISFGDLDIETSLSEDEQLETTKTAKIITNKKSREYYLQYIPFSDSAKQASHNKISTGLYTMGEIYEEDLKDNPKAIESYENLLNRYPGNENRLQVYYRLYTIAKIEQDKDRVSKYQQKIINEFPNSNYAKLMTNPNYLQELMSQEHAKIEEYNITYSLFQAENFNQVIARAEKAMKNNPGHELYAKYDYLYTISAGLRKDTLSFIMDLQKFKERYPSTDLAENAELLIKYLQNKEPRIIELQKREVAKQLFSVTSDEEHYFVYIVPSEARINQLIFNILNFNLDNFDDLRLEVKKVNLDNKNNLCMVSKFKNGEESMIYLKKIILDENIFEDVEVQKATAVVISETNYKALTDSDKAEKYILFFKDNYGY